MKVVFILIGLSAVFCAKPSVPNRQKDSSGSDSRRRPSSDVSFPDYFRVEVEIQRLEDPGSKRSDGKSCDSLSKCDPEVSAAIDIDRPLSPFPGATSALKTWPTIFAATNNDSPTIGKSVNRDVCGGSVNKINARVHILDNDTPGIWDLISDFDCLFDVQAGDISADPSTARWSEPLECTSVHPASKTKLFARQRAYQVSGANCGSSETDPTKQKSDIDSRGVIARPHVAGEHDLVRLDVEVVQLLNPQGITYLKVACDTTSKCDPEIYVNLDTDKPLTAFPGSKPLPEFVKIFAVSDVDSPPVNKNISKDICGGSLSNVNLRAQVYDHDSLSQSDVIESFNCLFKVDYGIVARDASSADWTPTQNCAPLHPGHDIRLQYRYRIYDITPAACGIKASSG